MDNRLRFLYRMASEMWGRRRITGAGNGETGASAKAKLGWQIRPVKAET